MAQLSPGGQLYLVKASARMGFLNILEGLHSFISKLQRQMGKPSSFPLPPHPGLQSPVPWGGQRWRPARAQALSQGESCSPFLSSELLKPFVRVRPDGHICPGLLLSNQKTLLQETPPVTVSETTQSQHQDLVTGRSFIISIIFIL